MHTLNSLVAQQRVHDLHRRAEKSRCVRAAQAAARRDRLIRRGARSGRRQARYAG